MTAPRAAPGAPCGRCGRLMRLLNRPDGRVLVYWCLLCGRFAEVART